MKLDAKTVLIGLAIVIAGVFAAGKLAEMLNKDSYEADDED